MAESAADESTATEGSGRDEGRTGRPARLSRISIVRTAIGLADRSGLEAVTMRAVAAELDGVAAALYRHVRGRDELIDLIRDEVLAERREVIETGEWRADLRDFVRGLLTIHEAHPWLATDGLPSRLGPRALATTETAMSLLSSHPAGRDQKSSAIAVLFELISGFARSAAATRALTADVTSESDSGSIAAPGDQPSPVAAERDHAITVATRRDHAIAVILAAVTGVLDDEEVGSCSPH